uniref:Uncharacterized protein n=1 Tax=Loxodonta africana TaxID=9785 RepID=G3TTZ2_LOXAF
QGTTGPPPRRKKGDEEPRRGPASVSSLGPNSFTSADAGAWERCAGTAEAERLLQAFLGGDAAEEPRPLLVVRLGPGGLAVRPGLDAEPECGPTRTKGLFFLRTRPEPGHRSSRRILCGDVPRRPWSIWPRLFSEVVIPVLANEKNHLDPHMVCQDVRRHADSLQCDLMVILEQVKGKTLLPLPVGSEKMVPGNIYFCFDKSKPV